MAYTLISTQTLLNPTATVTFSGIPQGFKDLVIEFMCNGTTGGANSFFQLNNDIGTNYSGTQLYGSGTAAASLRGTNSTNGYGGVTSDYSAIYLHLFSYANTNTYKTTIARGGTGASGAGRYIDAAVSLWRSTAAVTSIKYFVDANIPSGSTFKLWGVS